MKIRELGDEYLKLWKKLTGWRLFLFYTLHYTLLFFLLSGYIFEPFRETGTSFIWVGDGRNDSMLRLISLKLGCPAASPSTMRFDMETLLMLI